MLQHIGSKSCFAGVVNKLKPPYNLCPLKRWGKSIIFTLTWGKYYLERGSDFSYIKWCRSWRLTLRAFRSLNYSLQLEWHVAKWLTFEFTLHNACHVIYKLKFIGLLFLHIRERPRFRTTALNNMVVMSSPYSKWTLCLHTCPSVWLHVASQVTKKTTRHPQNPR